MYSSDDSDDEGDAIELVEQSKDDTVNGLADGRVEITTTPSSPLTKTEIGQLSVNIIISFVGAGLLGVPEAFSRAGWLAGSAALMTISGLNVYAVLLLPKVRRRLAAQEIECHSYGQLGLILLGTKGEILVNICLLVSQTGFATAYLIFIAESLHRAKRWKVVFGCVPGLSLLVQAQNMRHLSPFSLLANCANLIGLSAVLIRDWETLEEEHEHKVADPVVHAVRLGGVLYVMAITVYSMEGIGLVLNLEGSCRNPQQFPTILARVVGGITLFMVTFGIFGYLAFGNATEAPVTLNLGHGKVATMVQGALCVALYLTYPVMMFPVWNIAERRILELRDDQICRRIMLRFGIVLTTAVVAYAVPDFGEFLSLVGSSLCTILGFLLPCYFHLQVFGSELGLGEWLLNIFLMVGGSLFALVGTVQSMSNMASSSSSSENDRS